MLKLRLVQGRGNKMTIKFNFENYVTNATGIAAELQELRDGKKLSERDYLNLVTDVTAFLVVAKDFPDLAQQMADIIDPTGKRYIVPMLKYDEIYLGVK